MGRAPSLQLRRSASLIMSILLAACANEPVVSPSGPASSVAGSFEPTATADVSDGPGVTYGATPSGSQSGGAQPGTGAPTPAVTPSAADRQALSDLARIARGSGSRSPSRTLVEDALKATLGRDVSTGPQEVYESPGGAQFTWQVQDRYSLWSRAWQQVGTVDVPTPSAHTEAVMGYARSFVFPDKWPVTLDGCRTDVPDGTPAHFSWTVRQGGAVIRSIANTSCQVVVPVPDDGIYSVSLDVRSDGGWHDSLTANVNVDDIVIVSLGDSSASGEGNPDEAGLDAEWVDRRCHRSMTSGHALTAESLEESSDKSSVTFLSFACSGAQMGEGILDSYAGIAPLGSSGLLPKHLWEVADLESQIDQAKVALCRVPVARCGPGDMREVDYVFVSIGINDLAFSEVVMVCADLDWDVSLKGLAYLPDQILTQMFEGPCDEDANIDSILHNGLMGLDTTAELVLQTVLPCDLTDAEWEDALGYVPDDPPPYCFDGHQTFAELRRRLDAARIRATKGVYLSTYPVEPFSQPGGSTGRGCGIFTLINQGEAEYLTSVGHELNELIHREAVRNGFYSVPGIVDRFNGHGYCAGRQFTGPADTLAGASSWFVALSESLVKQLGIHGTIHPNRRGHEAIRDAFLDSIVRRKPDRTATHNVSVTVTGVRFDVPGTEITGVVQAYLLPEEVVRDSEETPTQRQVVMWKRIFNEEAIEIRPGTWMRLDVPFLRTTVSRADVRITFGVYAIARGRTSTQRARQLPPDHPDPLQGPVLDPGPGGGYLGFYRIQQILRIGTDGWEMIAGARVKRLQGEVDFGNNPGSITVEYCISVTPVPTRIGPLPASEQLPACRSEVVGS